MKRRRRLTKRGSKKLFRRTAVKTKKKNVLMNLPRGGIQL